MPLTDTVAVPGFTIWGAKPEHRRRRDRNIDRPKTILVLSWRDRMPLVVMSVKLFDKPENVQ